MLTLLSPPALWALTALVLPVALHLWRQPPRTVVLGSLRFLRADAGPRWRDLRWREKALLWTRLALLALLVFLLARPVWRLPTSRAPQRWILLDPAAAPDAPTLARLRALQAAGYHLHLLAAGLPEVVRVAPDAEAAPIDLWSLLAEADGMLPAGSSLAIFSPARLASLQGLRPTLRSRVEWVETPDAAGATPRAWLASLHPAPSSDQPPVAMVGVSEAVRTTFADNPPSGWKLETRPASARFAGPGGVATPWTNFSSSHHLHVLILYDSASAEEARVLAAALRAAASLDGSEPTLKTTVIGSGDPEYGASDWTFWLSAKPAPPFIENRRTSLFEEVPGSGTESAGWIVPESGTPGAEFLTPPVRLWRSNPLMEGSTVWTDEHGAAILTRMESEYGPRWHFASRFDLTWTDLPRAAAFPAFLRALLSPTIPFEATHDLRRASGKQAEPAVALPDSSAVRPSPVGLRAIDLHWPLWWLVVALFGLERVLSHLRPPKPSRVFSPPAHTVFAR